MGKSHNEKQKKPAKKAIKNTSKPFRFLDLLPEIRRVVYRHHFAGVSVLIQESTPDDDHADQILEDVVAFCSRFTDLQDDDTDEEDDHYGSEGELITSQEIRALSENKWRDVYSDNEDRDQIKIHSAWAARLGWLLLTCKQIRDEAQPILGASVHLKVLEDTFEVQDLPKFCQHLYLSRIQQVTLQTIEEYPERYSHRFDVRQMPSLKLLTIIEPFEGLNRYEFVHKDVNRLVDFVHGDKDEVFIEDWFRKERQITRWAKGFADNLDHDMRQVMKEKNRACYWLRELMFHPEDRKFCIHYRRQLTLVMQTLGQATDKNPSLARYSNMKGNVRTQRRVLLDLDFDIDTRRVVSRHIQGRGGVDLSATADLKCWILSQFPEEIKELACNLNGGYSASNDSDIEDLIAEFGDEEDLVWRDVRYGAEGRGRTHEFGFFRRNLGDSEGDSEDDDYWGEDDYPDFSGVSDDGHHY